MQKTEEKSKRKIRSFANFEEVFNDGSLQLNDVANNKMQNDALKLKNPSSTALKTGNKERRDHEIPAKALGDEERASRFVSRGFRKMYLAALIVLLFAISMGVTGIYSATATADMRKSHSSIKPTTDEISWISSVLAIGALFGGPVGGYLSDAMGRRGCMIANGLPFVLGWIFIAYANTTGMILTGRLITGFSCGIVTTTTPMYLVEISTPEVRGLLGAGFQLFAVAGNVIMSTLGAVLSWRWLAIFCGMICVLASASMLFMPESPRWLIAKKKHKEAVKSLTFLQGEWFDAEAECQKIEDEIKKQPAGGVRLREFLSPIVYKPLILSILLVFFHQLSGISAVLFYTVDIFKAANISLDANLATIIVSIVQLLSTLLSTVLMDKAGRRPLLLISAVSMAISLLIFAGYDFANSRNADVSVKYGWLPVICLTSFIAAYSIGFGPAPWFMVSEMTSTRFRSEVSGIVNAINWGFVFIISYSFKSLEEGIHAYGAYSLYATFCLASIIMVYFYLPETKGKKIEEIEEFFRKQ